MQVKIATFPGSTTQGMNDRIKPLLRRNPDQIIIHVGTNSLSSSNSPRECAEEVVDLANQLLRNPQPKPQYPVSSVDLTMTPWQEKFLL